MKINAAQIEDIDGIVDAHIKGFDGFFLTLLGKGFLRELYKSFAFRDYGLLRVLLDDNNNVIGFASGTTEPEIFYKRLRKERGFIFFCKAIPGLLSNPFLVIKKLWYALFYKGEKPSGILNAALLSSIAVLPDASGKSYGKKLLMDYESTVKKIGCESLYLTTDKSGNDGVISFYKRNGYSVESEFIQADGREMLTLMKKLVGANDEQ